MFPDRRSRCVLSQPDFQTPRLLATTTEEESGSEGHWYLRNVLLLHETVLLQMRKNSI